MAKKIVKRGRARAVDVGTLRPGDIVRVGSRKALYKFECFQRLRGGNKFVVARGPMGEDGEKSGVVFYVGPGVTTRLDPVSGKRKRLQPLKVWLVEKARK